MDSHRDNLRHKMGFIQHSFSNIRYGINTPPDYLIVKEKDLQAEVWPYVTAGFPLSQQLADKVVPLLSQ